MTYYMPDTKRDVCRLTWSRTSPLASHFNVTAVGRSAVDVGGIGRLIE